MGEKHEDMRREGHAVVTSDIQKRGHHFRGEGMTRQSVKKGCKKKMRRNV